MVYFTKKAKKQMVARKAKTKAKTSPPGTSPDFTPKLTAAPSKSSGVDQVKGFKIIGKGDAAMKDDTASAKIKPTPPQLLGKRRIKVPDGLTGKELKTFRKKKRREVKASVGSGYRDDMVVFVEKGDGKKGRSKFGSIKEAVEKEKKEKMEEKERGTEEKKKLKEKVRDGWLERRGKCLLAGNNVRM